MSVFRRFGVEPIINASGTVTRLGGAPMPPQVLAAFQQAAQESISLDELQAAASRKIAEVTNTEAGLVTSGAAGALTLGTAAILAGHDLRRIEQLPHCDGFPNEVIIAREHRSGYDHAIRAAGARLVEIGFNEIVSNAGVRRTEAWEYEAAITPQTAGIACVWGVNDPTLFANVVAIARRHSLPILVDAAGELPPRANLKNIAAAGADLVAFSGGKAIRGPQSTGILCGKQSLVSSAALQMLDMDDHFELWNPPADLIDKSQLSGHPRHGIGRALKVSKEEIAALLTALELFTAGDYDAERDQMRERLQVISGMLKSTPATCRIVEPDDGERWPILEVDVGESALEICRNLRNGRPPVYVGHGRLHEGILVVNPICLTDDNAADLGKQLQDELTG